MSVHLPRAREASPILANHADGVPAFTSDSSVTVCDMKICVLFVVTVALVARCLATPLVLSDDTHIYTLQKNINFGRGNALMLSSSRTVTW